MTYFFQRDSASCLTLTETIDRLKEKFHQIPLRNQEEFDNLDSYWVSLNYWSMRTQILEDLKINLKRYICGTDGGHLNVLLFKT